MIVMNALLNSQELIHRLVRSAIECGAIEPAEGESFRRQPPCSALSSLLDLSFYEKHRRLRDDFKNYERDVIRIGGSDQRMASVAADLLNHMTYLVEADDQAIRRAREYRHRIDPERNRILFWKHSQNTLHRVGITDPAVVEKVVKAASASFALLAKHALQFTPTLDPDSDPATGLKLWMFYGEQNRDYVAEAPVSYQWPAEADFVVHHDQCNCDENTLRTALMCLENPSRCPGSYGYEREPFPFATVAGRIDPMKWPRWPSQRGPYILQPPSFLCEFLDAVALGIGLSEGATAEKQDADRLVV